MPPDTGRSKGDDAKMSFNVAIDGPAGAGKSTIARAAAERLGFIYVDTGAMYRTIALGLLRAGTDVENEQALKEALDTIRVEIGYEDGEQQMLLNGENVTGLIRTGEVTRMASISSAKALVRDKLLSLQRDIAARENVLMDGRDIGTRILPDAQLKVFLTASAKARALRRYKQMKEKGMEADLAAIEAEMKERDERDMNREVWPLRQAPGAVLIDSSDLTIEETVQAIVDLAEERMNR